MREDNPTCDKCPSYNLQDNEYTQSVDEELLPVDVGNVKEMLLKMGVKRVSDLTPAQRRHMITRGIKNIALNFVQEGEMPTAQIAQIQEVPSNMQDVVDEIEVIESDE